MWIAGGTFRMGDERFYPEEQPVREVRVDGFWIDATPVTVASFRRFVRATGHVTTAEVAPDAAAYPDADPNLLVPGSLVFQPTPRAGPARRPHALVGVRSGRVAGARPRAPAATPTSARGTPSPTSRPPTPRRTPPGPARSCRPRPSGSTPRAAASTVRRSRGATRTTRGSPTAGSASSPGGGTAAPRPSARSRPTATGFGHDRQRLGVDRRPVHRRTSTPATGRPCDGIPRR